MKKVRIASVLLTVVLIVSLLASCTPPIDEACEDDNSNAEILPIDPSGDESSQNGDTDEWAGVLPNLNHTERPTVIPTEGMAQFGREGFGFITLPDDWTDITEEVEDPDDPEFTTIAFGDPSGINSITILYIDASGGLTPADVLNHVGNNMVNMGGENITPGVSTIGDIEALAIYCLFPDTFTGMTVWAFEVHDGYIHSIMAQGSMLVMLDMFAYIEASYVFER